MLVQTKKGLLTEILCVVRAPEHPLEKREDRPFPSGNERSQRAFVSIRHTCHQLIVCQPGFLSWLVQSAPQDTRHPTEVVRFNVVPFRAAGIPYNPLTMAILPRVSIPRTH